MEIIWINNNFTKIRKTICFFFSFFSLILLFSMKLNWSNYLFTMEANNKKPNGKLNYLKIHLFLFSSFCIYVLNIIFFPFFVYVVIFMQNTKHNKLNHTSAAWLLFILLQNTTAAIADNGINKQIVYRIKRVLYWFSLQSVIDNVVFAVDRYIRFVDDGNFAIVVVFAVVHVAVDVRNCNILFTWKLNQRNNSHAIALPDIVVGRSPLLRSRVRSWSVDSELHFKAIEESKRGLIFYSI